MRLRRSNAPSSAARRRSRSREAGTRDRITTMDADRDDFPARCPDERPPRPQEQALIDLLPEVESGRILCTSAGLAQFAQAAARQLPSATIRCHYFDLYQAEQARRWQAADLPNLAIDCAADFAAEQFDVVALPLSASGEAELVRDLLQAAHQRLRPGGQLLAATDNPRDSWLQEVVRELFDRVGRRVSAKATVYLARKSHSLKRVKDFGCVFAFRDRGRLIQAYSRPGVFAHRRLDPGTRHLINALEVVPGQRVLDIGCGSGGVALAAAMRVEGVQVHALDSHARAVECTRRGAALNALTNLTTELTATGPREGKGSYHVALANPPYYAQFRIARRFLLIGWEALQPGGQMLLVTRMPDWYIEHMPSWFEAVQVQEVKGYCVLSGRRPA